MSRRSLYLACVLASVPAVARDAGTTAWSAIAPVPPAPATGRAEFDLLVLVVAGLAVALGLAWRRL